VVTSPLPGVLLAHERELQLRRIAAAMTELRKARGAYQHEDDASAYARVQRADDVVTKDDRRFEQLWPPWPHNVSLSVRRRTTLAQAALSRQTATSHHHRQGLSDARGSWPDRALLDAHTLGRLEYTPSDLNLIESNIKALEEDQRVRDRFVAHSAEDR
jgi:hypothetical protein